MQKIWVLKLAASLMLGFLLALGGNTLQGQEMPHGTQPDISLGYHDPKEGQQIQGTEVFVQIMFHGEGDFTIKSPDGTRNPNEGHIDLLLDQALMPDPNQPVPPEDPEIAHTDGFHTFKGVPANQHSLTAVLVDGAHYPIPDAQGQPITATVRFTTLSQTVPKFDDLTGWARRGDVDGDGDLDLVLLDSGSPVGPLLQNIMGGMSHMMGGHDQQMHSALQQFAPLLHSMTQPQAPSPTPTVVAADLDGDGDEEVLIVGASFGPVSVGMGMNHPMSGMQHDNQMEHNSQAPMEHKQCTSMMGSDMPHDPEMHDGMEHSNPSTQE